MIKIEEIEVFNFQGAFRGMRNPLESWSKSDSYLNEKSNFIIGKEDMKLALKLIKSGTDHSKFMRQILICMDIIAPLYWWKEMDQYRVAVVTNSCSTMHTIHKTPITPELFSVENLEGFYNTINYFPNIIDEATEEWKQHPNHSLYIISNQGRVKRKGYTTTHDRYWKERILTNIEHDDGYLAVNILKDDGERQIVLVHRLVAETFIPNPNNLPEVNHKNGNKQYNLVNNLEWCTRNYNEQHSYDVIKTSHHSFQARKKLSKSNMKLNEKQREEIKDQYEKGLSSRELAKAYNVSHTNILDIVKDKYGNIEPNAFDIFVSYCDFLEQLRLKYLETKNKNYWDQLIQMLPSSFIQKRTWTGNYQILRNIYFARKNHKQQEWRDFCKMIEELPYSELITIEK